MGQVYAGFGVKELTTAVLSQPVRARFPARNEVLAGGFKEGGGMHVGGL